MARNFNDMTDSWESVATTVQFYGDDKYNIARLAGPGYFNDPDEVVVYFISMINVVLDIYLVFFAFRIQYDILSITQI